MLFERKTCHGPATACSSQYHKGWLTQPDVGITVSSSMRRTAASPGT
jgi:hypothetical protein